MLLSTKKRSPLANARIASRIAWSQLASRRPCRSASISRRLISSTRRQKRCAGKSLKQPDIAPRVVPSSQRKRVI